MKAKSPKNAPKYIEKVAYILPQGRINTKARPSGRPVRSKMYEPAGFVLIGMYESLGKVFTNVKAAAEYAHENGYTLKHNRFLTKAEADAQAKAALAKAAVV